MESAVCQRAESSTNRLAQNLTRLMIDQNVQWVDLARALNLPVMTVRRIVSGETQDPRISTLKRLADYFGVSVDSLLTESVAQSESKSVSTQWVPILSWADLHAKQSMIGVDLEASQLWQPIVFHQAAHLSKQAFALYSQPYMHHRFPPNTLFVVDPSVCAEDGDLVVVTIDAEPCLMQLQVSPPVRMLQPLQQAVDAIRLQADHHAILGVVMLSLLFNERLVRRSV